MLISVNISLLGVAIHQLSAVMIMSLICTLPYHFIKYILSLEYPDNSKKSRQNKFLAWQVSQVCNYFF